MTFNETPASDDRDRNAIRMMTYGELFLMFSIAVVGVGLYALTYTIRHWWILLALLGIVSAEVYLLRSWGDPPPPRAMKLNIPNSLDWGHSRRLDWFPCGMIGNGDRQTQAPQEEKR